MDRKHLKTSAQYHKLINITSLIKNMRRQNANKTLMSGITAAHLYIPLKMFRYLKQR